MASAESKGVPVVRERSEQEIADARERIKRGEAWAKLRNSPIGRALHLKDAPHFIKYGHGVLDTWLAQAEIVGNEWMKRAAEEGKRLLTEYGKVQERTPEAIAWAIESVEKEAASELYMTRKQKSLAKKYPDAMRAREYLNWYDSKDIEEVATRWSKPPIGASRKKQAINRKASPRESIAVIDRW